MEKAKRAPKVHMIERQARFFNLLLDNAKSIEEGPFMGIYGIEKPITEIIEDTGCTTASIIRPNGKYTSVIGLVDDFSEGNLKLFIAGRNSDSLIFDLPVIRSINSAVAKRELILPEIQIPRDLSRYKVASDR